MSQLILKKIALETFVCLVGKKIFQSYVKISIKWIIWNQYSVNLVRENIRKKLNYIKVD